MKNSLSLTKKICIGKKLLSAKLFKQYLPLTVSWAITHRCNLTCPYCGIPSVKTTELATKEILLLIDKLADLGTERISFTGGEPLLRDDLGKIINYVRSKDILCAVNTNGEFLGQKIDSLKNISNITISLDGRREINNELRPNNSYDKVMEALNVCNEYGIPIIIATVLSKRNLNEIDFVLDIAKQFNSKVSFQPAQDHILGVNKKNDVAPNREEYRQAITALIKRKASGDNRIYNSIAGLRHLYHWPNPTKIACLASRLHCRIDSDGTIFSCGHTMPNLTEPTMTYKDLDRHKIHKKIPIDCCNHCWCATMVEFNLIASFNMNALLNGMHTGM